MWRKFLCCFTALALMLSCSITSLAANQNSGDILADNAVHLPAKLGENGRQELMDSQNINDKDGRALTIERFSVNSVTVYPIFISPEDGKSYYNESYGYKQIKNDQTNWLDISPASTKKLLEKVEAEKGQVVEWRIEVKCKVENISRPDCYVYHYVYGDQTQHIEGAAVNPNRTFTMYLPILDTTEPYENGVRGVFYYYNSNGRNISVQMGGGVTLNSTYSGAK